MSTRRHLCGLTLVELIIAIVILGIGLAGVILAISTTVRSSADPLIRKQMLSIAEELLEEALLKPFAVNGTAPNNRLQGCGTGASRTEFDDVSDYADYATTGICDIEGNTTSGLENYDLRVSIDGGASLGNIGNGDAKKVTVKVNHGADSIALIGWRTAWAQ